MPQIEPIVVARTPAGQDFTFTMNLDPLGTKDGLTSYAGGDTVTDAMSNEVVEDAPTSAALQSTFTVSLHRPSKTSRISKVRLKLVVPVKVPTGSVEIGSVPPIPTKSHENSADITYLFSEKSTEEERKNLDTLFRALIAANPASEVIQKLKSMY